MSEFIRVLAIIVVLSLICAINGYRDDLLDLQETDLSDNDKDQLALSVVRVLCNLRAKSIHVCFESSVALESIGFVLKSINHCGTAFLALEYNSTDNKITPIKNDGIMMHLLIVLKSAAEPINLSHIRKKSASKHQSFFIVMVESSREITNDWLYDTFVRFWKRWILNVVVIFWENDLQIYTYSPFSDFYLKKLPPKLIRKIDLFPTQILNMNKYQLRISLYPEEVRAVFVQNTNRPSGSDGFMSELIVDRLNASMTLVVPEDNYSGEIYNNDSADGSIGYIIRDEADVALNTRYLLPQKFSMKAESTHIYGRDDLCIMVPASALETPLFNIFKAFDRKVWAVVLTIPFILYFLIIFILPNDSPGFLSILGPMLANSIEKLQKRNVLRIIMGFWLFYCFLILNIYEGNLTSNIVLPKMTSPINTIQQLVDSPLEILIYKRFAPHIHHYLNSSKEAQLELKRRIRAVSDRYFQRRLHENDLTKAYIDKQHITSFRVNSRPHTSRGRPLFHRMMECPVPFYTVYVVPYGSPYLGYINKILRQTQEHGIILHWDKYMEINSKLSGKSIVLNKGRDEDDLIVIEMVHLEVAIYMLGIGWCLSTVIFISELFLYHGLTDENREAIVDLAGIFKS